MSTGRSWYRVGMCGRYTITTQVAQLAEYFDANVPAEDVRPNYNVTPASRLPVILDTSPHQINLVTWGFVPHWDKQHKMKPQINARLETAAEKPMFRDAYKKRHCLILADGFYEWKRDKTPSVPFRIALKHEKPFAMAGIWDAADEDEEHASFAILTAEANSVIRPIHNRMPVILPHGKEGDWLSIAGHERLPPQIPAKDLVVYEVSRAVNTPRNNDPRLLEPVGSR